MDFLVVQWFRLQASSARATGLILGQGTKIPHATWMAQPKKNDYFNVKEINYKKKPE